MTNEIRNGKKIARVIEQNNRFSVFYVQELYGFDKDYQGEQVLQVKDFATEKRAIAWAKKVLEVA